MTSLLHMLKRSRCFWIDYSIFRLIDILLYLEVIKILTRKRIRKINRDDRKQWYATFHCIKSFVYSIFVHLFHLFIIIKYSIILILLREFDNLSIIPCRIFGFSHSWVNSLWGVFGFLSSIHFIKNRIAFDFW